MITIGIISPKISLEIINKVIDNQDFGCVFKKYVYHTLEEIDEIYDLCKDSCDVIFCSGELGYNRITTVKGKNKPCSFVSYDDKHILSIFLNFVLDYPHIALNRVYCDFLTPHNNFMNMHKYLNSENLPYMFESYIYNYENLTKRALELLAANKIDIVLTRSTNLVYRFKDLGIPYLHFLPTEDMITESILNAVNNCRLDVWEGDYKICIILRVIHNDKLSIQEQEYHNVTMHKHLVDYRKICGYTFSLYPTGNRFEIYCNAERYNDHSKKVQDLICFLKEKEEITFRLGAGISSSDDESHYHAELALQESIKYGKNDGFIIHSQTKALTGPLSLSHVLNYSYNNLKAMEYSQQNGINESNLLKIVGFFQMDNDAIITAQLLSKWLNITTRSCNRIIQQLLDSDLISEIKAQKQDGKGRPMRRYRFNSDKFNEILL